MDIFLTNHLCEKILYLHPQWSASLIKTLVLRFFIDNLYNRFLFRFKPSCRVSLLNPFVENFSTDNIGWLNRWKLRGWSLPWNLNGGFLHWRSLSRVSSLTISLAGFFIDNPKEAVPEAGVLKKLSLACLAKLSRLRYSWVRFGLASAGYRGLVVHDSTQPANSQLIPQSSM